MPKRVPTGHSVIFLVWFRACLGHLTSKERWHRAVGFLCWHRAGGVFMLAQEGRVFCTAAEEQRFLCWPRAAGGFV